MQITVNGVAYILEYSKRMKCKGHCDRPDKPAPKIRIRSGMTEGMELRTLIHELLHASAFDPLSEEFVEQASNDIAAVLNALGWRKEG